MSLDDIIPLSSTVCTRMQTKLSTRRWTLHDVVDTIVSDSCDIIVPRRSDESPASASARSRLNSARVMSRVVHYSRLYRVSTCAWRQFRSGSLDLWRNIFTHCRIFRCKLCNDVLFVFFLLVYFFIYYRESSYASAVLGDVILSVRPSVTHVLCDKTKQCTADILIPQESVHCWFGWKVGRQGRLADNASRTRVCDRWWCCWQAL